jgi:hypothetical protein
MTRAKLEARVKARAEKQIGEYLAELYEYRRIRKELEKIAAVTYLVDPPNEATWEKIKAVLKGTEKGGQ